MLKARLVLSAVLAGGIGISHASAQDRWAAADQQLSRLDPSAFTKVPPGVVAALQAKHCTIPQATGDPAPHNIIRGSFVKPGQTDWAALCSRAKASAIMIVWGGEAACSDELEVREDRAYLKRVAGDRIVYTRRIAPGQPRRDSASVRPLWRREASQHQSPGDRGHHRGRGVRDSVVPRWEMD
jgi:hypothetical protein